MPGIYDFGIRPPDVYGSFQQGAADGRAQGLRSLMGDYYGKQDSQLGEIARMGGNPAALQAQQQDQQDRQREQLGKFAALLTNAPPGLRAGLYRQMRPQLAQIVPDAPPEYTPEIDQLATQIAQQFGGGSGQPAALQEFSAMSQGLSPEEVARARRINLGLDPRAGMPKIMEAQGGIYGVNPTTLTAAPVTLGGAPQAPQQPSSAFTLDDNALAALQQIPPQERATALQAMMTGGTFHPGADGQPVAGLSGGAQLQPQVKPQAPPAGYRPGPDGNLQPIPGGPADIAIQARRDAAAARKAAEDAKAAQQAQAVNQRQAAAVETADGLIQAIDTLTKSNGFSALGTAGGDVAIGLPYIRTDAKDANAQLKNISGQVALATMSKLKALSAQGATGFGALSQQELRLLENSIATLQSDQISNAQLKESLKVIRDKMQKITDWKAASAPSANGGWSIQKVE